MTKRAAKTQPKAPPKAPESEETKQPVYVVSAEAMQKTVELLGSVPLTYPISATRDALITYYSQLKVVEVQGESTGKT